MANIDRTQNSNSSRRLRYKNKTRILQILYNEHGEKFELVPNGTILLTKEWAARYMKVLEAVPTAVLATDKQKADKADKADKAEKAEPQ